MPLANRNPLRNPTLGSYLYGFTPGDISTPGARKDSLFLAFDLLGIIFPTATLSLNSYKYISTNTTEANVDIEGYFRIYPNEIRINKSNIDSQNNRDEIIDFLNSDETTRIIFRDDQAQIIGYYFITFAEEEEHHIVLEVSEIAYENNISPFQDELIYSVELGYVAVSGKYVNTNLAPETIGGFPAGEPITPPEGLTQEQFNDKLFSEITLPSISFNVNNQIIEKGTNFSQTININFSQNDAGALIGYSLEKDGTEVSTTQSTAFTANNVIQNFTLQAKVSYDAGDNLSAGTISTALRTITQVVPQWKGQKSDSTSLNNSTYNALNSALTKIVQNGDNTSITVTAGNYGFFLSVNPNATIIEDGTGFAIAPSAFTKNTITAKLANGSNFTLTEYIINPATDDFTYNLQ